MPWKEHSVKEERFRFIEDWKSGDWNISELCRYYEITRATGYKWVDRYESGGLEALGDQSRAPRHHPNAVGRHIEDLVIGLREKHPTWGAAKIRRKLEPESGAGGRPAESTVGAILKRYGLTVPRKRRPKARPSSEPLAHAGESNAVWCVDYKGWFRTGDGIRIDPLTVTDAYSRYLFRCQGLGAADYAHSKPVLEAAFREYGLPARLRTDNGAPFGSNGESGLTALSVWWIKLGIVPERIRPGKPQENGRHERMHRTLKQETASPPAGNRRAQQERFDRFRKEYNEERPHEALGLKTPADYYRHSSRIYPERLRAVEYPSEWIVRRVSPGGQMRWGGKYVFVAHALSGEPVGLEQIDDRQWRMWFSFYEIGTLNTEKLTVRRPEGAKSRKYRPDRNRGRNQPCGSQEVDPLSRFP
jgi:putative transposase